MPRSYYSHSNSSYLQDVLQFWENPLLLLGILLLLVALAILLARSRNRSRPILVNSGENGQVAISHKAVRDLVAHTCNEVPTIRYNKSVLTPVGDNYRLQVHILVSPQIRLAAISQYLQEQLNEQLSNSLDFNGLSGIDVIVDGFLNNPAASGKNVRTLHPVSESPIDQDKLPD